MRRLLIAVVACVISLPGLVATAFVVMRLPTETPRFVFVAASVGMCAVSVLCAFAIFRSHRRVAGIGLEAVALGFAIIGWAWSVIFLFELWRVAGAFVGIILTPLAAIPFSIIVLAVIGRTSTAVICGIAVISNAVAFKLGRTLAHATNSSV